MSETTLTWPRRGTFVDRDRRDDNGRFLTFESDPDENDYATVTIGDEERAEHYFARGWVEGTPDEAGLLGDETGGSDEADARDVAQEIDPDVFVQAFASQSASEQADAIAAGEVDAYLEAIEAANADGEEYQTVQDAIDERRDALGS